MKRVLEEQILNAYKKTMLQKYSIYEFCINTYAEENICLNKVDDLWELSIYERGQKNILKVCYNLVDACFAAFDRFSEKEASILKDFFIELIYLKETA